MDQFIIPQSELLSLSTFVPQAKCTFKQKGHM